MDGVVTRRPATRTVALYPALGVGLVLAAAATGFKIEDGTHSALDTALSTTTGLLYLGAGVTAHVRRPSNASGLLMALVGVALFTEDLKLSHNAVVYTFGVVFTAASSPVLLHLVVAFPTGRLTPRWERLLVVTGYLVVFGFSLAKALVSASRLLPDVHPANLLMVIDDPAASAFLERALRTSGAVLAVGVVLLLVYRWAVSGLAQRSLLTPVTAIGLAGAIVAAAGSFASAGSQLELFGTATFRILSCLWPLAFLTGVLRARVTQAELTRLLAERDAPALADLVTEDAVWRDSKSLETLEAAAVLVRDNRRLSAQLAEQLAEVEASRARIVAAGEAERNRVRRDLHDGAQQRLAALALTLRMARRGKLDPAVDTLLRGALDELLATINDLRELASDLRPAILSASGPVSAVRALLERVPFPAELVADDVPRLDQDVETAAYFVVAEALTNVLKHAQAGRVTIVFAVEEGGLRIEVADDGVGGVGSGAGTGLAGIRDRVRALGGTLTVESPPGAGTTVSAVIPVG